MDPSVQGSEQETTVHIYLQEAGDHSKQSDKIEEGPSTSLKWDMEPMELTEGLVNPWSCQQIEIEPGHSLNLGKHIQGPLWDKYIALLKKTVITLHGVTRI